MHVFLHAALIVWVELWSEEHGRKYLWDADTGEAAWRLPAGGTLDSTASAAEPLVEHEGWSDCTADAAALFNGGALQRAWRSLVRTSHPDKGGSSEAFQAATATRDFLKSPRASQDFKPARLCPFAARLFAVRLLPVCLLPVRLTWTVAVRYFAHRTLHGHDAQRSLTPFDVFGNSSVVRGARAVVGEDSEGWPRLTVEASLAPPSDLGRSHVWRIALAAADASTIEYTGDAAAGGGYDVCCHFVAGSRCVLRARDDAVAIVDALRADALKASVDGAGGRRLWYDERHAHYSTHDCPLPDGPLNASVNKPLHLKAAGRWSAVLILSDGAGDVEPPPTACVALLFSVRFIPRPPRDAPPPANATAPAEFEQRSHGRWCRDGADLLEGQLDTYTDCDQTTRLCRLTTKCRARCSRRADCRFYTTYSSGLCQLSSRCEDETGAKDPSARTFARRTSE